MLKVAMLSCWHVHAKGYAKRVKSNENAEVVAVWNEEVEAGQAWADELGCKFYADLDELLANPEIDAVICDTPTTHHRDVLIKAAKAGKHIFTEKALAPTLEECYEIKQAIEEAGVTFCISYPYKCTPFYLYAKKLIEKGFFGKISYMRTRNAHDGVSRGWLPDRWFDRSTAAGGAMMDLGCHPVYLVADIMGKPKRVTGMFTAPFGKPVDENAVALAEFEGGSLAVMETGFISTGSPFLFEIHGTDGCMIARGNQDVYIKNKDMAQDFNLSAILPKELPQPINQFIDACINGTGSPKGMGLDDAIALTELLQYSYIGDEDNKICVIE